MTATIHPIPQIHEGAYPEYLAPSLNAPTRGPITDFRRDFDALLADMKAAWDFATAKHIPVLSVAADRNGAYIVVSPIKAIYEIFGDECGQWRRHVEGHLVTEYWLGCIGHIRVFWREFKCTTH